MNKDYIFEGILENNLKINFKKEDVIFLHVNYRDNYFFINSKNIKWLKECKMFFRFINNFNLKIEIKLFQNFCKIKIHETEFKYYYQVDPSHFESISYSENLKVTEIENNKNIITFEEYLKDKRVVIVAPGGYLKGLKKGKEIDNYDIVVRLNTSLPIKEESKEDLGTKTHILYNCLNKAPFNGGIIDFENFELDWIACPYPKINPFINDINNFHKENKSKFKFHIIETFFYLGAEKEMETRPNTGVGAILDLLQFPIKELYLTGFTFLLKSGYLSEYKDYINTQEKLDEYMKTNLHDRIKQVKYLKTKLESDKRIKMDKILIDLLSEINT